VFRFITSKPLWVNFLIAIVILALLLLLFLSSLNFFTQHGKVLKIPTVTGKKLADAQKFLEDQGFEVIIQDSTYSDTIPPLNVIKQFPEADALVKVNRTVYLTVNRSVPPEVVMPNLVGMSYRNAVMVIRQFSLKLGDTTLKPDFAKNSVLNQMVKGRDIDPGSKLRMGTEVSLVLGSGLADIDMGVPDLIGLTYAEAKVMIEASGLGFGATPTDPDVRDTLNAYIYRQSPERHNEERKINRIRSGQMIDIWLSTQKPVRDTIAKPIE